jgi:DNA-binding CsgD family transcriptional regulator
MESVIGRDRELALGDSFLAATETSFATLIVEGEAGIGKTTVWREILRRAHARGLLVLSSRPAAAEARLTLATVADLLEHVPEQALKALPDPQRQAIDIAVFRQDIVGAAVEPRLLGTALRTLLTHLASHQPVLLAIDDLHWVDAASAATLAFALRRLTSEPVGVLGSRRTGEPAPALADSEYVTAMTLGPMSVGALYHMLRREDAEAPPRSLLIRIHEASGGKPLFALEIARLLAEIGAPSAAEPLPVPPDVETLLRERVARLPRGTRDVLVAAAALGRAHVTMLGAAVGRQIDEDLKRAESGGIVALERDFVVFTHPLFGAALTASATLAERRAVHRRLAGVAHDPEERARHLALGTEGPDEAVALALEEAARAAARRGAPAAAAELLELAVRATPPRTPSCEAREVDLAYYLSLAGDFSRSSDLLERLVRELESGDLKARALLLLADIEYWTKNAAAACARAAHAIEAANDPVLEARCHAVLGISAVHDVGLSVTEAEAALELLAGSEDEDPATLSLALCARARGNVFLGNGLDSAAMQRAMEVEAESPPALVQDRARFKYGQLLKYVDDLDGALALLEEAHRAAIDEGDEASLLNVLHNLTVTECWAGNLARAMEHAGRAVELAAELGAYPEGAGSYQTYVVAHLGDAGAVSEAVACAGDSGEPAIDALLAHCLALVELPVGEYERADEHLVRSVTLLDSAGFGEPAIWRVHGDAIEAALAVGDVARATEQVEWLERHAARVPIPWTVVVAARSRALLEAHQGNGDAASVSLESALAAIERCPLPFELGRTLLTAGQLHRRAKRRRAAVDALERSRAVFEQLGASLWLTRATEELSRVGVRRRAPEALTETEERVARLAATGKTNREVAQALFISPKTVEANLARVYRKLGIRSRAELGALVGPLQDAEERS